MLIPFEINGKLYHLTKEEIQAHMELEEKKEKSAQEAKLLALILNREHSEKIKKEKELRRKRIHQFRGSNRRNFDVHKLFRFGDISVTEWDELGAIISKKQGSRRPDDILAKEAEKGRHKSWNLRFELEVCILRLIAIEAFEGVDVDTLLSYMVMASNINTPSNIRFYEIMRSMIENHLDRENLKSKKFKLEAGFNY
ncbi:hypothetical protein Tco_1412924 [Tanacetum coccineum]